jgi:hypothetical protein
MEEIEMAKFDGEPVIRSTMDRRKSRSEDP